MSRGPIPALGASLAEALAREPDVLVDFTVPDTAIDNAREAVAAGVHVVIGTTGFELRLSGLSGANVFIAPNFAIGAVLMMKFAVDAARHMRRPRSSNSTATASSMLPAVPRRAPPTDERW